MKTIIKKPTCIFLALGQGLATNPQHMMQFTPLLYSYQMAMAQAAQVAGKYNYKL